MNEKAAQIGMTNSIFADTYGENTAISRVTARDMVRMGVEACSYNELCRVWQTNEKTITTFDSARREIFCQYGNEGERTNLETLEESYPVLGKKNGYMPLSGSNKIFTMIAVCVVDGKIVVGSLGILGTMSADDGRAQRPVAMKELMDNVKAIMNGGSASTPTYYDYGCAAELPVGNPAMYERKDLNWLYEYNPDTQFAPASCTKVMTAMVMLDYVTDIHAKFKVLNAPSGRLLKGTDIFSYEQALYLMMLPSNGTACYAVARAVGTQMITAYS
jgi:D-alanyl-D-alanine carboxypeptidase